MSGTRLEFGGRRAVLTGKGQSGVPKVMDREVRAAGCLARRAVAVHEVTHAHVVSAVTGV